MREQEDVQGFVETWDDLNMRRNRKTVRRMAEAYRAAEHEEKEEKNDTI